MTQIEKFEKILAALMQDYRRNVPDVDAITQMLVRRSLIERAEDIENDHLAFRTFGTPLLGISSLEKVFLNYGYIKREAFTFEAKKLDAYWYAPPKAHLPRVFISELRLTDLSPQAQSTINKYTSTIDQDPCEAIDLNDPEEVISFFRKAHWPKPTLEDYKVLAEESEYAAWVLTQGYALNHFTISVHNLPKGSNTIDEFNEVLKAEGFTLNQAGGEAKVSRDGLLLQSSTKAMAYPYVFACGTTEKVATAYVEFAERRPLPEYADLQKIERKHRRDGFEAANANHIFESTFFKG